MKPRITSYINNLHPYRHTELYDVIAKVVSKVIPLWNATLTPLQSNSRPPPRIEVEGESYDTDDPEPDFPKEDGDWHAYQDQREDWRASRIVIEPEPKDFKTPEQRLYEYSPDYVQKKGPLDLRNEYGQLQIIVKLANIHLTPEKPDYEGGTWHVEEQLNENMYSYLPALGYTKAALLMTC